MIELTSVRFGTDAEVFLRTRTGHPIPVCGMVGGTKDNPKPMEGFSEGFAIQEDNAALEFNVPAAHNCCVFIDNVRSAFSYIDSKLPATIRTDLDNSVMEFDEEYLKIPEMGRFGCDPDYNAFSITTNDAPRPPRPGFRSAAAHIHIGWKNPDDEDRLELIRLADVFVTCNRLPKETEADKQRRCLYGKAGAFRPKAYGVEHRVLSNSWLRSNTDIRETLVAYQNAIAALNSGITVDTADYEKIQETINTHDVKSAKEILDQYWDKLNAKLEKVSEFDWDSYYYEFR